MPGGSGSASSASSKESSSKESSSEESSSTDTWHSSASTPSSRAKQQRAYPRAPRSRVRERASGDAGGTRERGGGRDVEQKSTGSSARETKGIGKQSKSESESESEQDAKEGGYVVLDVLSLPLQAFGY